MIQVVICIKYILYTNISGLAAMQYTYTLLQCPAVYNNYTLYSLGYHLV